MNRWGRHLLVNTDHHLVVYPSYERSWPIYLENGVLHQLPHGRGDGMLHLLARSSWLRLASLLACNSLERSRFVFWVVVRCPSFIDLKAGIIDSPTFDARNVLSSLKHQKYYTHVTAVDEDDFSTEENYSFKNHPFLDRTDISLIFLAPLRVLWWGEALFF